MQTPNFTAYQFINEQMLNEAADQTASSMSQSLSGTFFPGLIYPEALSLGYSGLSVGITAPLPFQVLFGSGVMAAASGTITGQPTQSYVVSFSGTVPGSGTVTAYLVASHIVTQQNAFQVVGPPPGHPDYNPNFNPITAYNVNVDSIALSATLTPPDNFTTFEIGRATVAAAATGVTLVTTYQVEASDTQALQVVQVSGAVILNLSQHGGRVAQFTAGGTCLLPLATSCNGRRFTVSSPTVGGVIINAQGSDQIYGVDTSGGVAFFSMPVNGSITLVAEHGLWQAVECSPNSAGSPSLVLNVWGGISTGTPNAQSITTAPAIAALASGQVLSYMVGPGLTNTGPLTLAINGISAVPIYKPSTNGPMLFDGREALEGTVIFIEYGNNQLQMIAPYASLGLTANSLAFNAGAVI